MSTTTSTSTTPLTSLGVTVSQTMSTLSAPSTPEPYKPTSTTSVTRMTTFSETTGFTLVDLPMAVPLELSYSTLSDSSLRHDVAGRLSSSGVAVANFNAMVSLIQDYNRLMEPLMPYRNGWQRYSGSLVPYDREGCITRWGQQRKNQSDLNARLFAFMLMRSHVEVEPQEDILYQIDDISMLHRFQLFDLADKDRERFLSLFSYIRIKPGLSDRECAQAVLDEWDRRGVVNRSDQAAVLSLIAYDDQDARVIHAGVVIEDDDGILLVEKTEAMLPYQALRFTDRIQLRHYFVNRFLQLRDPRQASKPVVLLGDRELPPTSQ